MRCLRMGPYTLFPGSFGHQSPGIMTGTGGASLDWDRRRRVTPVPTASQETWPEAEPWDEDSLWREPRWNADRRAAPPDKGSAAPDGAEVVPAFVGVPLPFSFVIASQRVRPEVAGPMIGSAKQSSRQFG